MPLSIAIDGPSASGKSTLAKVLAEKYGFIYIDTGALYRTVGLYVHELCLSSQDAEAIVAALPEIHIEMQLRDGRGEVYLNGRPVGDEIRTPVCSLYASDVSKLPEVRAFLLSLQRDIAAKHNVVMDGRDIGTVILPDADVKLFMSASDEERARRRWRELNDKGIRTTLSEVMTEMRSRDENDQKPRHCAGRARAGRAAARQHGHDRSRDGRRRRQTDSRPARRQAAPGRSMPMNKAYRFFKLLLKRPFQWLYRTTVIGAENEPAAPYIACANHTSFADPFLEGLALREQVSYIAKASLQRFRIIRWFFKTVGVIPIHRDESDVAAIRTSVNALREGRTVGIYPQGTRIPYRAPEPNAAMAVWACWRRCPTVPSCRSPS